MTPAPRPDPATLAAALRLWVLELVVWLAEALGDGPLGADLRAWVRRELDRAERGAETIAVLAAMALVPAPFRGPQRARRPAGPPPGFRRVRVRGNDMRRMTRHLFPRERDLALRAARLGAFLDAIPTHAKRLARRIARVMPASRLSAAAPPATACIGCAAAFAPQACDTS